MPKFLAIWYITDTPAEAQGHEYERIPESTKLHNSEIEQVVKLMELCPTSGVAQPYLGDHEYVISVSIAIHYKSGVLSDIEVCGLLVTTEAV